MKTKSKARSLRLNKNPMAMVLAEMVQVALEVAMVGAEMEE
jgi:hypothetical protein